MNQVKPAIVTGILVAAVMAVYKLSLPYSLTHSVFGYPLLPGELGGDALTGGSGSTLVWYFSCWIVNTGFYWGLWVISSVGIKKTVEFLFYRHYKSAVVIGILVAAGMIVFERAAPYSLTRSVLDDPLLPGAIAGFVFGQQGEYMLVGYLSCWIVNTALYWGIWILLSLLIWPRSSDQKL